MAKVRGGAPVGRTAPVVDGVHTEKEAHLFRHHARRFCGAGCRERNARQHLHSPVGRVEFGGANGEEAETVEVPFRTEGGVKIVRVEINGEPMNMIFDTGCSRTSLSLEHAQLLYARGLLTQEDILGKTQSRVATGEVVEDALVRLREVTLADGLRFENVVATVSLHQQAPLLLGNEVLNRTVAYTIDNRKHVIRFTPQNDSIR